MYNDLTFFTNENDQQSLYQRFRSTLRGVQYFDILVGYFRTSGFHLLEDALQEIEQIRILVGLNVDRQTFEIVDQQRQMSLIEAQESAQATKERFGNQLENEIAAASDSYKVENGIRTFMTMLQEGRIQIRAHPSQNIHAKVYIHRFHQEDRDFGRVITGSSNFSYSGLKGQYEFNVELKESQDVRYALEKFDKLWAEAVDLSEQYVDTINRRTWLNDQIPPYHLFLKFLYEYFQEEINADTDFDTFLPEGFMELAYQKQAVISAKRILDTYNGVFLADVVGLGKTFISALLAQQLDKGRILIICPPVLQVYWEETFREFRVPAKVESLGKLERMIERGDHRNYQYVFVDEAHRFRNEETQRYEHLHQICAGKKVVLVSATPLNNRVEDIQAQLKLFQPMRQSLIPGLTNLEHFFNNLRRELNQYEKGTAEYVTAVKEIARKVRQKVLRHVMVRRTRNEIVQFYHDDISKQGLFFPRVADPKRILYQFDVHIEQVFERTITRLQAFHYARYTPRLYLHEDVTDFEAQSQRNIGAFMKSLLVKRLESSFHAFRNTLGRFIASYERFIEMYDNGRVLISPDLDVYDLLDRDDSDEIQSLIEQGLVDQFAPSDFQSHFRTHLADDLTTLREIQTEWDSVDDDPKLNQFQHELQHHPLLEGQKAIIFTESAETAHYLYDGLQELFPGEVMAFTSSGGQHAGEGLGTESAKERIEANFSPSHKSPRDDIRLLVTTDVLAEGINLHRSAIVINYDLPWNPTRVLQRVGRVNRVGTAHETIYIFNFSPTAQADKHLGLKDNIVAKIQAFHDMLGEDARYLSEDEEVSQHDLSGRGRALYDKLSRRETYVGDDETVEERSDLEYLQIIRQVRDESPELFEKIKRLPVKARAGWKTSPALDLENDYLITFFRHGRIKRFYLSTVYGTHELDFLEAADRLACQPDIPRHKIPKIYYDLLQANKTAFKEATTAEHEPRPIAGGGHTNAKFVLKHVRAAQKDGRLTGDDEDYLKLVRAAYDAGRMPRSVSKRIRQKIERQGKRSTSLRTLQILRNEIEPELLTSPVDTAESFTPRSITAPREIILSAYLLKP